MVAGDGRGSQCRTSPVRGKPCFCLVGFPEQLPSLAGNHLAGTCAQVSQLRWLQCCSGPGTRSGAQPPARQTVQRATAIRSAVNFLLPFFVSEASSPSMRGVTGASAKPLGGNGSHGENAGCAVPHPFVLRSWLLRWPGCCWARELAAGVPPVAIVGGCAGAVPGSQGVSVVESPLPPLSDRSRGAWLSYGMLPSCVTLQQGPSMRRVLSIWALFGCCPAMSSLQQSSWARLNHGRSQLRRRWQGFGGSAELARIRIRAARLKPRSCNLKPFDKFLSDTVTASTVHSSAEIPTQAKERSGRTSAPRGLPLLGSRWPSVAEVKGPGLSPLLQGDEAVGKLGYMQHRQPNAKAAVTMCLAYT